MVTLLIGSERHWEPENPDHARYWTARYPTRALLPMMALVDHVRGLPFERVRTPTVFLYSRKDQIVDPKRTDAVYDRWGAARKIRVVIDDAGDPDHHVPAGRILSPETTRRMADILLTHIRAVHPG